MPPPGFLPRRGPPGGAAAHRHSGQAGPGDLPTGIKGRSSMIVLEHDTMLAGLPLRPNGSSSKTVARLCLLRYPATMPAVM